jgi:hypothetical protein
VEAAARIAAQLTRCRQRGLDDLDKATHNQERVQSDELDQLAYDYCEAIRCGLYGRVAQIRRLLKDSLVEYADRGNRDDAQLIEELFFDPEGTPRRQPAGQRLNKALDKRGYRNPKTTLLDKKRFASVRRMVFTQFAEFLIGFVREAQR